MVGCGSVAGCGSDILGVGGVLGIVGAGGLVGAVVPDVACGVFSVGAWLALFVGTLIVPEPFGREIGTLPVFE